MRHPRECHVRVLNPGRWRQRRVCYHSTTCSQGWARDRECLETYLWSRLGLKSWRFGLDLDLSGLEPIAIFTQIYLRWLVTKTLSPHKLNRSVNNNPCRMHQNSTIRTSSLWHMMPFVLALVLLKWRVNSVITLKMNQQEDRDRVSDIIQELYLVRFVRHQQVLQQMSLFWSVFSKASLIMRPARSWFSRANVSKLGFPELYREAVVTSHRQVCHTNVVKPILIPLLE